MKKLVLVSLLTLAALAGCEANKTKKPEVAIPAPTPAAAPITPATLPPSAPALPPTDMGTSDLTAVPPAAPAPAPKAAAAKAPRVTAVKTAKASTHRASAKTASVSGHKYTVKKGDTLSAIAKAKYGSASAMKKIVAANPGLNPNKIRVGQVITLP